MARVQHRTDAVGPLVATNGGMFASLGNEWAGGFGNEFAGFLAKKAEAVVDEPRRGPEAHGRIGRGGVGNDSPALRTRRWIKALKQIDVHEGGFRTTCRSAMAEAEVSRMFVLSLKVPMVGKPRDAWLARVDRTGRFGAGDSARCAGNEPALANSWCSACVSFCGMRDEVEARPRDGLVAPNQLQRGAPWGAAGPVPRSQVNVVAFELACRTHPTLATLRSRRVERRDAKLEAHSGAPRFRRGERVAWSDAFGRLATRGANPNAERRPGWLRCGHGVVGVASAAMQCGAAAATGGADCGVESQPKGMRKHEMMR